MAKPIKSPLEAQPMDPRLTRRALTPDRRDFRHPPRSKPFSGLSLSLECFDNQGHRNFRIITLLIENGEVIDTHYSDAFANFESDLKLASLASDLTLRLNNAWNEGRTWFER